MTQKYSAQTIAFGAVDKVTRQIVVDDSTGERAKLSYDKATGSILVEDTVDPDSINPVSGRAVAEAVAGASGEVPIIGSGDNGKVLTAVVDGESKSAEWADAPTGVPSTQASDNGKVLGVTDTSGTLGWVNQPVSNVTTADKQFTVGVNGTGHDIVVNCPSASSVTNPATLSHTSASTLSTNTAVSAWSYDYSTYGDLSAQNLATLTIPSTFNTNSTGYVEVREIRIMYYCSNISEYDTILNTEPGTSAANAIGLTSYGFIAGTYTLPGTSVYDYGSSADQIRIEIDFYTEDYSDAEVAASIELFQQQMATWTLSWPNGGSVSYNVEIPDIPAVTSADNNKVLTATWDSGTSTGSFGWATAGGGGGGSASISDIIRDINAANVQAGQTMQDWVNGLASDIQAGKVIRLIATTYSGDSYTDIAYLDHYILTDADPNDHMESTFHFKSARYTYYIGNPDNEYWELYRNSV